MTEATDRQTDAEALAFAVSEMLGKLEYTIAHTLLANALGDQVEKPAAAWLLIPHLVDIALNGPVYPKLADFWMNATGDADLKWSAVHPGYRFLQAVDALVRTGLMRQGPVSATKVVETICEELGCPTPRETAREVQKVMAREKMISPRALELLSIPTKGKVMSWDPYDLRLDALLSASAIRQEDPDVVECPNSEYAISRLMHRLPPPLMRSNSGSSFMPAGQSVGAVTEFWELSVSIARGMIFDEERLREAIAHEAGKRVLKDMFDLSPENIEWI
jgi:hypothetical protein